ncbi:MAG: ABC transporter permease [Planctomycetes bacterium]|nr:ABC transporter permease [Planctomycetota bacterium]
MLAFANPEFKRLLRSKLRSRTVAVHVAIGVFIYGGLLGLMYMIKQFPGTPAFPLLQTFFQISVGIQLAVVTFYGVTQAAQNIALERERATYDFQRLVTMGPWRLALGKLLGCAAEAWLIALVGVPFLLLPALAQQIPFWMFLEAVAVVFVFGCFVNAVGLTASAIATKLPQANGLAFLLGLSFFFFSGMVSGAAGGAITLASAWNPIVLLYEWVTFLSPATQGPMPFGPMPPGFVPPPPAGLATVKFFSMGMPLFAGFLVMNAVWITILYAIVARRLTDPELSFLSIGHGAIAFGVLEFLLVGSLWDRLLLAPVAGMNMSLPLAVFHGASAVILCALAFALTPSADLLRGRLHRATRNQHWAVFLELRNRLQDSPPVRAMILLVIGYVLVALGLTVLSELPADRSIAAIALVAAFALGLTALLLYLQALTDKGGLKAGAGLLVAWLIVPVVILLVLERPDYLYFLNPVAYMIGYADGDLQRSETHRALKVDATWLQPLATAVVAGLLCMLAALRLRFLLDIQEAERRQEQIDEEDRYLQLKQAGGAAAMLAAARAALAAPPQPPAEGRPPGSEPAE